jgi:hypothetical protein
VLYATHINVPDGEYDDINKGWHEHNREPWKKVNIYIPNTSFSFTYPVLLAGNLAPVVNNTR